jgi:trigger factor
MAERIEEATVDSAGETPPPEQERLELTVDIKDAGPCRKHLKVCVPRHEISRHFDKEFSELVRTATVPGFRPGKTPRRLIERRFREEVSGQVKAALILKSLEQIGEEKKIEPLSEPNLDIESIVLPEDGDFVYEFEVEVPPTFDLPEYKGLKIRRPNKTFTEIDINKCIDHYARRIGELIVKNGPVEKGDYVRADVRMLSGKDVVQEFADLTVRVDNELVFRDGRIDEFAAALTGAAAGDSREATVQLSDAIAREDFRGKRINGVFVIKEVKQLQPATESDLLQHFGVGDLGELKDVMLTLLRQRLQRAQDDQAKRDVTEQLLAKADWEVPRDLVRRMSEQVFRRRVLELRQAGYSDEDINARVNQLRQASVQTSVAGARLQFLLQRIAQAEQIKVEDADLDEEVRRIAQQTFESVRRVRARLDKEEAWGLLTTQILERKTIERIASYGVVEEVTYEEPALASAGVDAAAVPDDNANITKSDEMPKGDGS